MRLEVCVCVCLSVERCVLGVWNVCVCGVVHLCVLRFLCVWRPDKEMFPPKVITFLISVINMPLVKKR